LVKKNISKKKLDNLTELGFKEESRGELSKFFIEIGEQAYASK
jgi:hypothetical protein